MNMKLNDAVEGQYHNKRVFLTMIGAVAIYLAFAWLSTSRDPNESWGALSLIAGCVSGLVMLNPFDLISPFADNMSMVLGNETII